MDQFLAYAASLDPSFPSRIEGASAEEIARIEAAADVPMPADYRKYLELMGRNDDGAMASPNELSTSAADIAEFYEAGRQRDEYAVPDGCFVIGVGRLSLELAVLELEPPHQVFEASDGNKITKWASSLRGMLYQNAFLRGLTKRYKRTAVLSTGNRTPRIPLAERVAERFELERLWFSDDVTICYASGGESIVASQLPGRGLWVEIATNRSPIRLWWLCDRLTAAAGIRLTRQR